ncbi:hypothetical protein P7C71_g1027, partial [Lecanoromycetidae sp. Uapishka_2]
MISITRSPTLSNHASSGLDRATFDVYENPERHIVSSLEDNPPVSSSKVSNDDDNGDGGQAGAAADPTVFAKVRRVSEKVRSRTKARTEKIFHASGGSGSSHKAISAPALAPAPSDAADGDRLYNPLPEHKGPPVKDVLHHPVDTVQSLLHGASGAKVASTVDNQVISHGADVNMVRLYDKFTAASTEKDKNAALDDLEDMKKARQDTYVRWTMDRHILKVRRVPPFDLPKPKKEDYIANRESGNGAMDWVGYGQDVRYLSILCRLFAALAPCDIALRRTC